MTTLAEHIIVAGAENRPPMLEKSMYDSCASRIRLFIKGKKNGMMMLDSIDEGPLVYPTVVGEDGHTGPKKYSELTEAQQLQDDCDVQATNIILHGLPPDLINDMHNIGITMQQVQVNTKFLNALPPEWSKFVTDVKLAKSLYSTNYDQLYAYLSQHERHANEVRIMRERYPGPLALVANSQTLYNPSQSPQHSVPSMHPAPQQFTPVYVAPIHHQHHHTLVNPLQQSVSPQPFISPSVTQQSQAEFPQLDSDGRVIVQQVQGRQTQSFAGTVIRRIATTSKGNFAAGQAKVVKCYNCLGEGHMVIQCTQPKRPRSSAWFKEKLMLVKAQEAGQILDEEQLAFIADPVIAEVQDVQEMSYSEQTHIVDFPDNEITNDSDIIPYSQYLQESQDAVIHDTNSFKPNDLLVLSLVEQMNDHVSLVNESLKKLKYHLASFDKVVKKRTTSDAISADEITKVQTVFNQMEAVVDQCFVDKNAFKIQIKQLSIDNDQLWNQIMSQEIVHIAVNLIDILNVNKSCVDECNKCLELETELFKKKDLIEKDVYDKLLKSYSTLEKHCISLELATQLNQEIFQKDNFRENQNAPTFNQLFEINELKAQSQENDTVIRKLKDRIKSLSGKDSVENSVENSDLNAQLQKKVFAIAALKNELRKIKGKNVVDTAVSKPIATIAPRMFKLDIEPISHRLKNNRDAHEVFLKKTIENTDTLRGLVECARKQNPSEPLLEFACMFTKHVQELLVYVSKTCPSLTKPYEKLVDVIPMNKDKKVRFVEPVTSSSNIPKQIDSLKTKDSNKPLLTSTGVNTTTRASGSKPSGNTKKNKISRPPSSN
ncbi:hypothetical protein Tco_0205938 [Tanacetum coccineum]